MAMVQRKFYFPEEMYRDLQLLAKSSRKTITQVLRELVQMGLKKNKQRGNAYVLLDLARMAEKYKLSGPRDLSKNHDKYFVEAWEESKGRRNRKQSNESNS